MRIAIVDDHVMFREILHKICVRELGHGVVGEASDGLQAVDMIRKVSPDLVLLDLQLPKLDGFAVIRMLRERPSSARILVLSPRCEAYTVYRVEQARVQGFLDKNTNTVATLKRAITAIGDGGVYFSAAFRQMKAARRINPRAFDKLLTKREISLLIMIGQPMSDDEIASALCLSRETVEKHRFNILHKLGLRTTTELVRYAQEQGFSLASAPVDGLAIPTRATTGPVRTGPVPSAKR